MTQVDQGNRWWINILLLLGTLAACLAAGEVALRLFGMKPLKTNPDFFMFDDTLGWVGRPNYHGTRLEGTEIQYALNNWGFRGEELVPRKNCEGKSRILFLGDSFMAGFGITPEERASHLISLWDSTLEAYNLGLHGYSTDQELLTLEKYGLLVRPAGVFVFFCDNDPLANNAPILHGLEKPLFAVGDHDSLYLTNLPLQPPSWLHTSLIWFRDRFAFGVVTSRILGGLAMRKTQTPSHRDKDSPASVDSNDIGAVRLGPLKFTTRFSGQDRLTPLLLKALQAECDRLGAHLLVFLIPSNPDWLETHEQMQPDMQQIATWCEELGIRCIDLYPEFYRAFQQGEVLFHADREHWSAEGNRVAAAAALEAWRMINKKSEAGSEAIEDKR